MILGYLFLVAAIVLCFVPIRTESGKTNWVGLLGPFICFVIGTYRTSFGAYALLTGVAILVAGAAILVSRRYASFAIYLLWSGFLLSVATTAVLIANLFQNPTSGPIGKEDRADHKPLPVVEQTPQDLIAQPWSTYDQHCDWPVASLMCKLCKIAYEPPIVARPQFKKDFGWESESINGGSMQGYVIDAGDDAIIVLRGTENHKFDIVQDLLFLKAKTPQGSMHGGFVEGYDSMHDQVKLALEKFEAKRVWITGHSLGGGMSIVCAYRIIKDERYPIAGVMTFGQPKTVLQGMADFLHPQLDGHYVFFVNDMDPVTRLVSPYKHFGHMVRWNDVDIIRSTPKKPLAFSAGPDAEPNKTSEAVQEEGYIDDLNDEQLDRLIENPNASLDAEDDSVDYIDGKPVMKGTLPDVNDHNLDAYLLMLEILRTHSTAKRP